jgi:hypothetical protein
VALKFLNFFEQVSAAVVSDNKSDNRFIFPSSLFISFLIDSPPASSSVSFSDLCAESVSDLINAADLRSAATCAITASSTRSALMLFFQAPVKIPIAVPRCFIRGNKNSG